MLKRLLAHGGGCAAWLAAVEAAMDFIPHIFRFGGIVGFRHFLRKAGKLIAGQLAFPRQLKSKLKHARLLRTRQLFDLFNHFGRTHGCKITQHRPHRQGVKLRRAEEAKTGAPIRQLRMA